MSKTNTKSPDSILLVLIIGLTLFGLIMIGSASTVIAERFRDDAFFFLKHQLIFGSSVGLVAFLIGLFVPYKVWQRLAFFALLLSLTLLVLVFVPGLQVSYGGASRWIGIGPITVQPTELTKLSFIIYLSALLAAKGENIRNFRQSVVPFAIIVAVISTLIILQPDIGTLMTIIIIATAQVYAAGFRLRHLAMLGMIGAAGFLILINTASYRLNRIITYLHPELDPQGVGYQINQALLAVSTGGVWGLGFGRSRQKYQYLPEPAGDSIFAIVAEELGLIRSGLVIGAFILIAWRGYMIAYKAPDTFGRLVAVGITTWIVYQTFINVGSIMAITPLTGIPLPFISYGGSALATMLLAAGILLNISRYAQD